MSTCLAVPLLPKLCSFINSLQAHKKFGGKTNFHNLSESLRTKWFEFRNSCSNLFKTRKSKQEKSKVQNKEIKSSKKDVNESSFFKENSAGVNVSVIKHKLFHRLDITSCHEHYSPPPLFQSKDLVGLDLNHAQITSQVVLVCVVAKSAETRSSRVACARL